jgi:CTP synthase
MVELEGHPHFVGCQFHPELKSRPMAPHPLFSKLVAAALSRRNEIARSAGEVVQEQKASNNLN